MASRKSSAVRAASGGSSTSSQQTLPYLLGEPLRATLAAASDAERASFWKAVAKVYRDRALAAVARQLQLGSELVELRRLLAAERASRLAGHAVTADGPSQCSASATVQERCADTINS